MMEDQVFLDVDASHLEAKLQKELEALEAANIHAIISTEDQANGIIKQIDRTLKELKGIDDCLDCTLVHSNYAQLFATTRA